MKLLFFLSLVFPFATHAMGHTLLRQLVASSEKCYLMSTQGQEKFAIPGYYNYLLRSLKKSPGDTITLTYTEQNVKNIADVLTQLHTHTLHSILARCSQDLVLKQQLKKLCLEHVSFEPIANWTNTKFSRQELCLQEFFLRYRAQLEQRNRSNNNIPSLLLSTPIQYTPHLVLAEKLTDCIVLTILTGDQITDYSFPFKK